ncbi:MAG: DUF262 domain-containing protein [Holophagales bacterium]|nr:DUF262 domain-containing protein [Holophagales bacterium]
MDQTPLQPLASTPHLSQVGVRRATGESTNPQQGLNRARRRVMICAAQTPDRYQPTRLRTNHQALRSMQKMPGIDLHSEYNSDGQSIHHLFDRSGEGLFVPRYQREYTWEEENVNQLFEDVILGVRNLASPDGHTSSTFLGTIIFTSLHDKTGTVVRGENNARPSSVQLVIDGQQRLSTISLLAICVEERLKRLQTELPDSAPFTILRDHCADLLRTLPRLYAVRLGRGARPSRKPKIIRAREDRWTHQGGDESYGSPVARFLATYIRSASTAKALEAIDDAPGTRVRGNVRLINQWIDKICEAHATGGELHGQYPIGSDLAQGRLLDDVLGFVDEELMEVLNLAEAEGPDAVGVGVQVFQLALAMHYLLHRCGVNCLGPTNQEAGFDMFQALNATGTPLTAMETLLPQVMQAEEEAGLRWEESPSREYMDSVDRLFSQATRNEKKNRRTNELLRAFALCQDGEKLGNKFSAQRSWIYRVYVKDESMEGKRLWLRNLARVADFYYDAWFDENSGRRQYQVGSSEWEREQFVAFLIRYLREARSHLSAPILARFFSQVRDGKTEFEEFIECAKACAAFFTLWRSARSTSGLDDVLRKYYMGSEKPVPVEKHSWSVRADTVSVRSLKAYFKSVLEAKEIGRQDKWVAASSRHLLYNELKTVCRFALFVSGHDRIEDKNSPGLSRQGQPGSCRLLRLTEWMGEDYGTLEHVAPQTPPDGHDWDQTIYAGDRLHAVGNLLLMPLEINWLAGNKSWAIKHLYYSHVGERGDREVKRLRERAKARGVELSKKKLDVLCEASHRCAVAPILTVGEDGCWDATLIDRRTEQIKAIVWKTLWSWLDPA